MADDESRNEHLPTEGDEIFTENGSETVENDQTGLNIYTGGAAVEDRREKPQTPKPKTETPIPTPERKMGKS